MHAFRTAAMTLAATNRNRSDVVSQPEPRGSPQCRVAFDAHCITAIKQSAAHTSVRAIASLLRQPNRKAGRLVLPLSSMDANSLTAGCCEGIRLRVLEFKTGGCTQVAKSLGGANGAGGASLRELPSRCFAHASLDQLIVPESITKLAGECFAACALRFVNLPSTLRVIERGAFAGARFDRIDLSLATGLETLPSSCFQRTRASVRRLLLP